MVDIGAVRPETMRRLIQFMDRVERSGLLQLLTTNRTKLPQLIPTPWYVVNQSGEDVPAYGCMQCTGTQEVGGISYITISKPANANGSSGGYLFNGSQPIATGATGVGLPGPIARGIFGGSSISSGGLCAPDPLTWELIENEDGFFRYIGTDAVADDIIRVFVSQGAAGGGGVSLYRFTLNADLTAGLADADILLMDGTDTGIDDDVRDPVGIFDGLETGDEGLCVLQDGFYYIIQAKCPA